MRSTACVRRAVSRLSIGNGSRVNPLPWFSPSIRHIQVRSEPPPPEPRRSQPAIKSVVARPSGSVLGRDASLVRSWHGNVRGVRFLHSSDSVSGAAAAVAATAPHSTAPQSLKVGYQPNAAQTHPIEIPEDLVAFRDVTLDEILSAKQARLGGLATVHEDDMVFGAIGLMEKEQIGAVLVKNSDGQFTGIFSERDYMRKIALQGLSSRSTPVSKVMTPHPVIVPSSETAVRVMQLMTDRRFRHVPVRHDATGEVVGIVSIGDIMANVLKEYKDTAKFMRDLVAGKYPA